MIKSIRLDNFFSFKDTTINFKKGTNFLVGINGSGKSNIIKAVQLLKQGVRGNADGNALQALITSWGGFESIQCQSDVNHEYNESINIEFTFDKEKLNQFNKYDFHNDVTYIIRIIKKPSFENYTLSEKLMSGNYLLMDFFNGSGLISEKIKGRSKIKLNKHENYPPQEMILSSISEIDQDKFYPLVSFKTAIKSINFYYNFDTSSRSPIRKSNIATSSIATLNSNGDNLSQLLNTIKLKDKPIFRKIINHISDINENFLGFDFNYFGSSGMLELMLDEKNMNKSIHVSHISDGTLKYFCLLLILCNPNRGKFVCIDEPEAGLHPDMLINIAELIKEASQDTTFLISTHSDILLNNFNINEVIVLEKNTQNCTIVNKHTEEDFKGWYEEFFPGRMWRDGDLGGNRW